MRDVRLDSLMRRIHVYGRRVEAMDHQEWLARTASHLPPQLPERPYPRVVLAKPVISGFAASQSMEHAKMRLGYYESLQNHTALDATLSSPGSSDS